MSEPLRILLADDDATFLQSTADLLRREGYACEVAADAQAAAERLRAEDFALLISDIRMPGNMDLDLVRDLSQRRADLPVILVTGYPSLDSAIHSVNLNVVAYVVKPFEFDDLARHVRRALRGEAARRALRDHMDRLSAWREGLETLGESLSARAGEDATAPSRAFVELTLHHVISMLASLRDVTAAVADDEAAARLARQVEGGAEKDLRAAVSDAIAVLEKTKNAFKSKDLGALRRRLEQSLRRIEGP